MALASGTRIGVFEISGLVGAGGMGEVYRARDTRLGRDVALKVLGSAFTRDGDRLARLEREARVLASLNHPHIAAIYGLEESGGVRALVLEFVEGQTLADRILAAGRTGHAALPLKETLAVARQVADALDAAHEKGIVHRDLKPANIKITPDGVVKVLDFGLAKAVADDATTNLADSPTMTAVNTQDGMILGTAAYMSPEQARGRVVDKRADIWAFGCVLFEMLTSRSPFWRDSIPDTLAAIVDREPDWTLLPPSTPVGVTDLLRRCLDKDVKRRLRDIGDASPGLEQATLDRASGAHGQPTHRAAGSLPWVVAAASLVALVAIGVAWQATGDNRDAAAEPPLSRMVQITSGPEREFGPVISPDGKWVAYLSDAGGSQNVWVRFVAGGEAVNLTPTGELDVSISGAIGGLEVSPDGSRIAVQAKPRGSSIQFATYEIPAPLPGAPRALLDPSELGMRWSPDGKRMAFMKAGSTAGDAVWVADADGTNRREVVPLSGGVHRHWLAWSDDGWLYYMQPATTGFNLQHTEIYRVKPDGGVPERVVTTLRRAMFPAPVPGGALIYSADPTGVELGLFWQSAGGAVRPLTFGLGSYAEPRASADGRVVVATRYDYRHALMRLDTRGPQAGRVIPLTDGFGGDMDPVAVPGATRIVLSSTRAGSRDLWTANRTGDDRRPLTSGPAQDERPALSPDGRTVAFVSDRGGQRGIWLVAAGGGAPRKLIDAEPLSHLSWSRDGTSVIYAAAAGTWPGLWSASVGDGQVRQIKTPGAVGEPMWSPVRDVIAYLEPTAAPANVGLSFIAPDGSPSSARSLKAPAISAGFANGVVAWSTSGRFLAVAAQNTNLATSVWIVDPDATQPFRKLAELPAGPRISGLTWADEDSLLVGHYDAIGDIVLMDQGR